jgi:ATP-binding cassette subfamily B multidrug efflux pump
MKTRLYKWLESRLPVFAPFDDRQTPPATLAAFGWHYLKPAQGWLALVFASALAIAVIDSLVILGTGWFVDLVAKKTPERLLREDGLTLGLVAFGLLVVRPLMTVVNETLVNQVVIPSLTNRIRWQTHLYTLQHSLAYFQGDFAGRLATRITQAGHAIRDIAVQMLDVVVYVIVYASVTLIAFGTISPWLALPMGLWMLGYGGLMAFYVPRMQVRSLAASDARSALVGRIVDSYTNILTVKLFARADTERSAVRTAMERHTERFRENLRLHSDQAIVLAVMNNLLLVVVGGLSLWLWSRASMTPGDVAAGLGLVVRLSNMSGWFSQVIRGVFENVGAVQESMETIARPHEVVDRPDAQVMRTGKGEIRFDNVAFHYGKGQGVIANFSLTIRPGEKVGIVGPSGAGKSTLVSLLLRLHDVEGGRILIDGQDIASVSQDSLREAIAVVTQDTSLLHRSIRDNIAYGRPDSAEKDIESAATMARAAEFIPDLVDHKGRRGYASRVGERGVKLSGGQRQRIAIARVMLKDAPILVLDEATSALDSEAEAAIQESLASLMAGKTVIAIAHRLSTIAALDRLVVMDGGRIVEEGSHAELIRLGGLYARLWERQSGGFLAENDRQARRDGIRAAE